MVLASLLLTAVAACDTGPAETLWDPDAPAGADPVIAEVEPADLALAGVDIVTIRGQNFSASIEQNIVFFNATRVPILQSSTTELTVRAPNLRATDVTIRISVIGGDAESFSNGYQLKLLPAAEVYGDLLPAEQPFALAAGADNSIYASIFAGGVSAGIKQISSVGESVVYSSTTFRWDGLDLGPDGYLYGVRGVRAVFRFPPAGGVQETWAVEANSAVKFIDVEFDGTGNLWAAGPNNNLYRIAPDKTITPFPFSASVAALKIVGSTLYAVVSGAAGAEVWAFSIDAVGNLSAGQLHADLSTQTSATPLSLEAATDGDLFVGTDGANPVWMVHADGSAEPLYPGVLTMKAVSLAWGEGPFLLMAQSISKPGDVPKIIKINTRSEGLR